MIEKIIKNVLELPGVDGACILDKKGNLLHNALPEFFLDSFLDDLARRVKTLYEAVDENYMPCDDYLLKFPQKYIRLRRSRHVFLLVSIDPGVNQVSLRMVTNIVLKHITPKIVGEMRANLEQIEIEAQELANQRAKELRAKEAAAAQAKAQDAAQAAQTAPPSPSSPKAIPTYEQPPERDTRQTDTASERAPVRGERVARPRPTRSFRGNRY